MQPTTRSTLLHVDGPVHVTDFGPSVGSAPDAFTVLCVHGLGSSSVGWRPLAEVLGPAYRVLAVDLPGHGRSPAAGRSLAVADLADVLTGVIDQLGRGPVHLVGHSMGAAVSAFAAASRPEQVDRMLLLAPPVPRHGVRFLSPSLLPHVALCAWPRVGQLALQRRRARRGVDGLVSDRLRLTCAGALDLSELALAMADDYRAAREFGEDPVSSFIEAARSVGMLVAEGARYREVLQRVSAPTSVLHGARDRVVSPTGLGQLTGLQPGWETRLVPGVGHSPHIEVPHLVAAAVQEAAGSPVLDLGFEEAIPA